MEPVHIEHFASVSAIADAKGEIFSGLEPGGVAIINRDTATFERLLAHARASRAGRVVSFGEHPEADVRAQTIVLRPDLSVVDAVVMGQPVTYKLGTAGRHTALNSLGVMAVIHALGADLAEAALSLAGLAPPVGRGERTALEIDGGTAYLVDESYNANPASVRAAIATLAGIETGPRGRRIAVLGDMLELGAASPDLHRGLAEAIEAARIDLVFASGPLMRNLFEALPEPPRRRRRHRRRPDRAADPQPPLRRRRDGQGIERQPHGADCRGPESPLRGRPGPARSRRRAVTHPMIGTPERSRRSVPPPETRA